MSRSLTPQPANGGDFWTMTPLLETQEWHAQPKWDGYRAIISPEAIISRHGLPLTTIPEELAAEARELAYEAGATLDAEFLAHRDKGEPAIVIHDLISPKPYKDRREILTWFFRESVWHRPRRRVSLTADTTSLGEAWDLAEAHEHEGIVLKDAGGYPAPGATRRWLKFRFTDQITTNQEAA